MTDQLSPTPRAARAHALALAVLGDPASTATLDALVQLAVTRIGADGGQISMLTDRQVSLCNQGVFGSRIPPGSEQPFEDTMCAYALRADDAVVIPDARADQRVAGIDAVASGDVGAYLGVPVRTADGSFVGVLCVFSQTPRAWTAGEQADMDELAAHVAEEFDRHAGATRTGV